MKEIVDLKDLMVEQLRDLYHGEKALNKLLPKIVENVHESGLKDIINGYLDDNESQVQRLRQVFEILFLQKRGETCEALKAMVKETNSIIKRSNDSKVRDAALITALQHIIHYQIAGYGAVCTYAKMLEFFEAGKILHINLEEEKNTDRKLAMHAEGIINRRAISTDSL
ncbi:MAG: DUF892 family protein [Cyclobacteriaceae bacterium]